ncbi:MAG: DEAD/DEAH box helicase, partial [Schwartzia sp.]|nr:DEAD/DEAH box helicase [Schwartzia sp. (in: firmicutes)]
MAKFDAVLEKYRKNSFSEKDKGTRFERLMKCFLLSYEVYRGKFARVWLWNEFPCRKDFGGKDIGIDLVAKTIEGDYWAVQCKCYQETSVIDKPAVDSFLAASGRSFIDEEGRAAKFIQRLWISTTNHWNKTAEKTVENQDPPFTRLGLSQLREAAVDWDALEKGASGQKARLASSRKPRPHQQDAIDAAHQYYKTNERGKLIMACGTGKTYAALKIAERETDGHGFVLFLVPSIALLAQTLSEWSKYAENDMDAICVCSDAAASKETGDEMHSVDLALPATTDSKQVASRIRQARLRAIAAKEKSGMTVVFSTYQSAEIVSKAQKELLSKANAGEKAAGVYTFDLIICDEAHRTTGVTLKGEEESAFVRVHDKDFLQAKRRLYMTATPRLYTDESKKKAAAKDALLCSMDDEALYGAEIYRIGFGEAVEKHLLSDYKVIVLTIGDDQIPPALQSIISDGTNEIQTDDISRLIGCINALSKRMIEQSKLLAEVDPAPMHTAVAFCSNIKNSQRITSVFNECKDAYYESLSEANRAKTVRIESRHVDGTMGASLRDEKLTWLKNTPRDGNECRILTNVRCLSEGVDVPSLDAVLFLSARNSQVDVVQSIGRVMRTAAGKKYGYIIIPVIVPVSENPEDVLDDNKAFSVVWSVLNALRAHDDRFNALVHKIALNKKDNTGRFIVGAVPSDGDNQQGGGQTKGAGSASGAGSDGDEAGSAAEQAAQRFQQTTLYFDELTGAIYARMVEKVGDKRYWEQWAQDVAKIAARHKTRIAELVQKDKKHRDAFRKFMDGLHTNINPYIEAEDAMETLAQHLITQPVFEALFENYSFVKNNSVSQAMQRILALLEDDGMESDRETLDRFYKSVRERCSGITGAEERQKIIVELYDKFFKTALPKTVGKLGIVYTPVEVVDFILHSVDDVLKKEFRRALTDENVHILDPFTGTGTFITRLLQSGLIKAKDLTRKYEKELHANEIVLLAYYIASINIENAYHDLVKTEEYTPFDGICLTDTFQLGESGADAALFTEVFPKNSARVEKQRKLPIRVIIGNPPYSVGQRSANDNAQNESYPKLEAKITSTYATNSKAALNKSLYDSYIKAFRWASDRLDEAQGGVIGFVSNAGWLDGAAMDGMRKCLVREFTSIYVFNLRGNQRTQGETSRREGGKIFGSGSRTPVAITLLVKNPRQKKEAADIYYHDIGDYLTREEKLANIAKFGSCMNSKFPVTMLHPNEYGDWLNQRNSSFEDMVPLLPAKRNEDNSCTVFCGNSVGINTSRDSWVYNFSRSALMVNVKCMIQNYNKQIGNNVIDKNPRNINWSAGLLKCLDKKLTITFSKSFIKYAYYR